MYSVMEFIYKDNKDIGYYVREGRGVVDYAYASQQPTTVDPGGEKRMRNIKLKSREHSAYTSTWAEFPIKEKKTRDELKRYKEEVLALIDRSITENKTIVCKIDNALFIIKANLIGRDDVKKFKTTVW